MSSKALQPIGDSQNEEEDLQLDLAQARHVLAEAEAELAREQAAVNSFRMHCRLMLDDLVERILELRAQREALVVRMAFLREGMDPDALHEFPEPEWVEEAVEEDVLLPTETPVDKAAEKRLFRELARRFHPDLSASAFERSYRTSIMAAINSAYNSGDSEALYDLAGELSPEEVKGLSGIADVEQRNLRRAINKMKRLTGKARRQLNALRNENTARLWRRTQMLDEQDVDGWSILRGELQQAIKRREQELDRLQALADLLDGDDAESGQAGE
ncbi:MAG: hypothetical protein ACK2UK_03640 [Candidatus Promineifilaceae bacterium]